MDATTLANLADALSKGGPVVLIVAIWVAYKAGQSAKEAVQALTDIRNHVVESKPVLQQIASSVNVVEETVKDIDDRTRSADMKLAAVLARQNA